MSSLDDVTDDELVQLAARFYERDHGKGLALHCGIRSSEVRRDGGRVRVRLADREGRTTILEVRAGARGRPCFSYTRADREVSRGR